MNTPRTGRVYLVGAGPGDPGLLTLRALECLGQADLVIYDRLVGPGILSRVGSEKLNVADLPGPHPHRQQLVEERMIATARSGKVVVRLKGGDPLIFGRGGEEAEALRQAGIPFEIVPGVTAALAAGCAGIPLTHRSLSSAVALVTGHECRGKDGTAVDWANLARFPGTLVIYMGLAHLEDIASQLLEAGKPPETPAAVIERASLPSQRTLVAPLGQLAARARGAGVAAPALVLVGPVVGFREMLRWFEDRPLFGKSVLVTRPRGQTEEMARALEELGAAVVSMLTIAIDPPDDPGAVHHALARLPSFQWLVFTSANGVRMFMKQLLDSGRDLRALGHLRLAAIGPRTAAALLETGFKADVVPGEFQSEALAEALAGRVQGERVLLARADRGREVLRRRLAEVAQVEEVAVYAQRDLTVADTDVLRMLAEGGIDYVALTSANIARSFLRLLNDEARKRIGRETRLVTISPVTSLAVRESGFPVAAEAREFTAQGVVRAICECESLEFANGVQRKVRQNGGGDQGDNVKDSTGPAERDAGQKVEQEDE